jgi:NAD(P)-dependent dehydrogenase (short-subunit alcohol dehydrogenase family)
VTLAGRIVLVTGGAGRLGRRIAAVLAREGAAVAVGDLDRAAAAAVGAAAVAVGLDVTDEASVERAVEAVAAELGVPVGVVNAAGYVPSGAARDLDLADGDRAFAVNVRGTLLPSRVLARRWSAAGTAGAIVNLSSVAATSARRGSSHYCASKAAVDMLTHVLAIELGGSGIRVNAVAPGLVLDEVLTAPDGAHPYVAAMLDATPLGRTGDPDEVADAVAFLLSERSAYTTGAILEVTGGVHVGRTHMPPSTGL